LNCQRCGKKGHITRVWKASLLGDASQDNDRSTRSSRSSASSSSKKSKAKELRKEAKKQFAKLKAMKEEIQELEASNICGSEDNDALSFFIMDGKSAHFCREQCHHDSLDLRKGWLLDPQSTCDMACSPELLLLGSLCKSQNKLRLATNASILLGDQKAKIPGYDNEIWFSNKGIAHVLSFKHTKASGLDISTSSPAN
jgi:hypothetical protein